MTKQDDDVGILNAILTNTAVKIVHGGLEPNDADLMTRLLFTGHIDLSQWKPGSERPVAVGHELKTTASWSRSDMQTESEMHGVNRTHAHGSGHATTSSISTASGSAIGSGENSGQVLTPPARLFGPNAPDASLFPYPTSQSIGQNTSRNSFEMSSNNSGESYSEFDMVSEGETHARGTSRGTGHTEGESEVFVTRYEWLPSTMYSLQEQLHRLTGELMNLAPREVFVKIRGGRPFRTRTADLQPAFQSAKFERLMLPLYRARCAAVSPYIKRCDQVDAELAARSTLALPSARKAEPDSWGESCIEYPDPPPPPDAPRDRPKLRVVRPDGDGDV